jgi:hypothetical protein
MKSQRMRILVVADRVSIEIGSFAIFGTLRTLSGIPCAARARRAGSRPISWSICREMRLSC